MPKRHKPVELSIPAHLLPKTAEEYMVEYEAAIQCGDSSKAAAVLVEAHNAGIAVPSSDGQEYYNDPADSGEALRNIARSFGMRDDLFFR